MYEIEKDVPAPDDRKGKIPKYPLRDMEIGDSFFVPANSYDQALINSNNISGSAMALRRNDLKDRKYSIRTYGKHGEKPGTRCWRIK
jgi:hypothetical protein